MNFDQKVVTLLVSALGIGLASGWALTVKDTQGRALEVEVQKYTPKTQSVRILVKGKVYEMPLNKFDPESQQALVKAAPELIPDLKARLSVGRRRSKQDGSSYMEDHTISMKAEVENTSLDIDLKESFFTILIIGEDTRDNGEYEILTNQTLKGSIDAVKKKEFEYKSFKNSYDSDRASINIGGEKYHAWVFVVHDDKGKVFFFDSSDQFVRKRAEVDESFKFSATRLKTKKRTRRDLSDLD